MTSTARAEMAFIFGIFDIIDGSLEAWDGGSSKREFGGCLEIKIDILFSGSWRSIGYLNGRG